MKTKFLLLLPIICFFQSTSTSPAATHVWKGSQALGFWSIAANWSSGGAPSVGEAQPIDLIFPANPTALNSICDVAAGAPLVVNSIVIQGGNYTFSGFPSASLNINSPANGAIYVSSAASPTVTFAVSISFWLNQASSSIKVTSGHLYLNGQMIAYLNNNGVPALGTFGAGHVHFGGGNFNRYDLTVQNGSSVHLAKTSGHSGAYSLVATNGTVFVEGDQQIGEDPADTANGCSPGHIRPVVTLNSSSLIYSAGVSQSIGLLTLGGGSVIDATSGGADVGLYNTVSVQGSGNEIRGSTDLGGELRNFHYIAPSLANTPVSLKLSGPISDGIFWELDGCGGYHYAAGGIVAIRINFVTVHGDLFLEGNNTYTGQTIINGIACTTHSDTAFGATNGGVIVVDPVDGGLNLISCHVGNEALTLGSPLTVSNNCSWVGPITLQDGGTFQMSADSVLTKSTDIDGRD